MDELIKSAHHSIMLMVGARKRKTCPNCGSCELHMYRVYDEHITQYLDDDGGYHDISDGYDFSYGGERCEDCDWEQDW